MGTVLAGLDGAKVVRTPVFDRFDDAAAFVVPRHEILVVDGDHGAGKTVLTDDFARRHDLPVATIAVPPRQSSRDIVRWLHAAIAVGNDTDTLTERDLQDDLTELLGAERIVVIRNAQRLTGEAAGQLEWLHSHPATAFTLIIEGGPGTAAALERDALLHGRIASTVTVPALEDRDLLDALQRIHPLFLGADTDLLVEIDTRVCHGNLRNWARVLQVCLHLQERAHANGKERPVLNRTFAKAVVAQLPATITRKRR